MEIKLLLSLKISGRKTLNLKLKLIEIFLIIKEIKSKKVSYFPLALQAVYLMVILGESCLTLILLKLQLLVCILILMIACITMHLYNQILIMSLNLKI